MSLTSRSCLGAIVLFASLLSSSESAFAGLLFFQPSDVSTGRASDLDFRDFRTGVEVADDFRLAFDSTATSIKWFGGYDFGSTTPPPVDDFRIRFYTDDSGKPAASAFADYHVGNAVNRTDTGANYSFGSDHFMYSADIPDTSLSGGTQYYLSILANTAGFVPDSDWFWASSGVADKAEWIRETTPVGPWTQPNSFSHAFSLNGTVVPEPSSLVLLGVGCAALIGCRWRSRRRAGAGE